MSKTTLATSVIAGYNLGARLEELSIEDEKVFELVGELGGSLGKVMDLLQKVDQALAIVQRATTEGDYDRVVEGLSAIKGVVENLVSDQDKIEEALFADMPREQHEMLAILRALGIKI